MSTNDDNDDINMRDMISLSWSTVVERNMENIAYRKQSCDYD